MRLLLDTHVLLWGHNEPERLTETAYDAIRDLDNEIFLSTLDHFPLHHRDPFDRLLVAQAHRESLTLVTHDPKLSGYAVPLLW